MPSTARIVTLLFHIVLILFSAKTVATPLVDISGKDFVRLETTDVQYLTTDESTSLSGVLNTTHSAWHSVDGVSISAPFHQTPVWYRFTITNSSNARIQRLLEIRWINLMESDIYQVSTDGELLQHTIGGLERSPRETGELDSGTNTSWLQHFSVAPGETRTIYVRLVSQFTTFMPAFIWEPGAFEQYQQQKFYWYCLAFGALLALAIYNLSLSVFTRDQSYLVYAIYALSAVLYEAGTSGIGHHLIWSNWGWFRSEMFFISVYLSFLMAAVFIRMFLNIGNRRDWIRLFTDGAITFWAAAMVFHFISGGFASGWIIEPAAIISCAAALSITAYMAWEGDISARYFTLAWSGLLAMTFVTMLMLKGYAPFNFFTENGQLIGFVVEMLLLSFALAERINRERLARYKAQRKALAMEVEANSEREQKLLAQEETLILQQEINQQLEERVAERTSALEEAMKALEQANKELSTVSITDALTQAYNRRHFDDVFKRTCDQNPEFALILIDIDHFKRFNDNYGHLVGDDCLRIVAATLRSSINNSGSILARYGGEEFAVLLDKGTQKEAESLAEELRLAIENLRFMTSGKIVPISISLGVSCGQLGEKPNAVIKRADEALYHAKSSGRNCVRAAC